jgi:hypothetical protein
MPAVRGRRDIIGAAQTVGILFQHRFLKMVPGCMMQMATQLHESAGRA